MSFKMAARPTSPCSAARISSTSSAHMMCRHPSNTTRSCASPMRPPIRPPAPSSHRSRRCHPASTRPWTSGTRASSGIHPSSPLQTKTPLICAVYARDASFTVNIPGFGDFFSGTTPTFHIPRIYGDFVIYRAYAVIRYSDPSRSAILANSLGG